MDSMDTIVHLSATEIYIQNFLPVIIVLVTMVWLVYFINKNNKYIVELFNNQNKQIDIFKEFLTNHEEKFATNLINAVKDTIPVSNDFKETNKYYKLFDIFKKINDSTTNDLFKIMTEIKACRTAIYLFHNGTKSLSGFDFIKISCVGEKIQIGTGIKERIVNHSNMPINIFDNMYNKLLETGRYIIINDEETMNTAKSHFISSPKVLYSQAVCIYDADNNVIGFILAEFDHVYSKLLADTEYESLQTMSKNLVPLFSYTNYANLTIIKSPNNDSDILE